MRLQLGAEGLVGCCRGLAAPWSFAVHILGWEG